MTKKITKLFFNRWFLPIWLALATFLLTLVLPGVPGFTERFYSRGFYPVIAGILSAFSSSVPFSLDDMFYLILILTGFLLLVLVLLRKIRWKKGLLIALNLLAGVYALFYWLWGFNYFREDMNSRLDIGHRKADEPEFADFLNRLITQTNNSYTDFSLFSKEETDSGIEASYQALSRFLSFDYPSGKRRAKEITLTGFFSKAAISGYFGPFFNEVHVNGNLLPVEYPLVLAHEKAHQLGITSEAEASFFGWLACSRSPSLQLQYSANIYLLRYFLYQGRRLPEMKEMASKIDGKVKNDFRAIEAHWDRFRNDKIEKTAGKVNDAYLKTNRVKAGIGDYSGIIKYVMDFSFDENAQKRINAIK